MHSAGPGDGERVWRDAQATHIDVRGLPPPEPMVMILRLIEASDTGSPVIVHLDREPIFLYPELDERGWGYERLAGECGDSGCEHEVRLQLVRLRS